MPEEIDKVGSAFREKRSLFKKLLPVILTLLTVCATFFTYIFTYSFVVTNGDSGGSGGIYALIVASLVFIVLFTSLITFKIKTLKSSGIATSFWSVIFGLLKDAVGAGYITGSIIILFAIYIVLGDRSTGGIHVDDIFYAILGILISLSPILIYTINFKSKLFRIIFIMAITGLLFWADFVSLIGLLFSSFP